MDIPSHLTRKTMPGKSLLKLNSIQNVFQLQEDILNEEGIVAVSKHTLYMRETHVEPREDNWFIDGDDEWLSLNDEEQARLLEHEYKKLIS